MSNGKDLIHMGFLNSKVLHWSSTDLSAWVWFCTSNLTAGCQISTSILGLGSINISCKTLNGKVLAHLVIKSKVIPGTLNDLSACVGSCTSSPKANFNFDIGGWALYIFPVKFQKAKFLSTWGLSGRYWSVLYSIYVPVWDYVPQVHSSVSNFNLDIWGVPYKYFL